MFKHKSNIANTMTLAEIIVFIGDELNRVEKKLSTTLPAIIRNMEGNNMEDIMIATQDIIGDDIFKVGYNLLPHLCQLSLEEYTKASKAVANLSISMTQRVIEAVFIDLS